jgi:hypothetical protein
MEIGFVRVLVEGQEGQRWWAGAYHYHYYYQFDVSRQSAIISTKLVRYLSTMHLNNNIYTNKLNVLDSAEKSYGRQQRR